MYTPPSFQVVDITDVHQTMREARSTTLITATHEGLVGTMLPVVLDGSEGSMGTIFAHVARANPQWKLTPTGEAMAIFAGAEAYVSP
jgi:transcriptional regulator